MRDRWVHYSAYGGTGLVAGTTIVVSGMWLTQLAHYVGIAGPMGLSLPVTVDAGGAVGTILWLTGPTDTARTWGRGVAVGALAASVVGNVLAHLIKLGMVPVSWQLVVGVSAVYPVMCWLMVHLLVLARSGRTTRKPVARAAAASKPSPPKPVAQEQKPAPVPLHVVETQSKRELGRAWFLEQVRAGRNPNEIRPADVDKAIGASGYSKKFIAEWRAEVTTGTGRAAAQ